jgi:hypothetical protein
MRVRGVLIVAGILLGIPPSSAASPKTAEEIKQNECAYTAAVNYNQANLALLQQQGSAPLMSVETAIAQRRLQEQFCQQFSRCLYPDPNNQSLTLPYLAAFLSCLEDEALEKYDAVPREK